MSTTEQYYKAIADYGGVEEDANYIAVKKGDKVRLIKKDKEWFTVEKDGRIGKVPKGILIQKGIKITQNQMNLPIQTVQPSPQIMNSIKSQNDQEPIKSMIPIDKQKSQIIPPGQKEQIEQQSDSLLQSITNPKSHSGSGSSKSKKKQKVLQQQNKLHQIIQDIQSIIESNTINDEEKEIKIKEIYYELKKKGCNELRQIFNIDTFKLIQSYINNCSNQIEKILLDIFELVAEYGIYKYQKNDPIFNYIESSGLFDKIEQMIKDKIEVEKVQMKYSNETEQLIRIHIQIMKGRESDQQMINICAKIINKNITNLLKKIKKLKQKENKGNKNKQENEEQERQIEQSSQLIKVILVIEEKDPNSEWKTRIPDQIIKIVKERICPLIHLNCPPEINCQQCVNVPQSPALIELKSDVFQTLDKVSNVNFEFKDMLKNYHNIILHLTHPLIQFASESQFKKKTNSQEQHDQQQTESSSSHSLITYSLNLLDSLIMDNNKCKQVINTPKALHSLIPLSGYKLNIHFNQENDQQTFAVRHSSRECLWHIQYYGGASAQSELVNARYARVLVIAISTASGAGEEQDEEICNGLYRISKFLRDIHQGNYSSFPPQPLLVRRSVEQIEEEGGNEEIDVQMNNKGCYGNIKYHANRAKGRILNYFIELGNPKPNWYYW